ncbi:MAG: ATP-binding cassette domain-containing protein [Nitrospinae bacterium]|nr:ATP-binding cassette domain-containing protein [Nitrospinota bacterium]
MIRLEAISKSFGAKPVIRDFSLEIGVGERHTLLGKSGCGKTTLLRMIAGFEPPDAGKIFIAGQDVSALPIEKRPVGFIFQNSALFPHMTVYDNIAAGPRIRNLPAKEIASRVEELLKITRLTALRAAWPGRLSGGEAQRVAIARAIVIAKVSNSRAVLMRASRESPEGEAKDDLTRAARRLSHFATPLARDLSLDEVRGKEGEAARIYFGNFNGMIKNHDSQQDNSLAHGFTFEGRKRMRHLERMVEVIGRRYSPAGLDMVSERVLQAMGLEDRVYDLCQEKEKTRAKIIDLEETVTALTAQLKGKLG